MYSLHAYANYDAYFVPKTFKEFKRESYFDLAVKDSLHITQILTFKFIFISLATPNQRLKYTLIFVISNTLRK